MVDALPILLETGPANNFKIKARHLEEVILNLSNPKALIINSPNNPTGSVYTRKELQKIAEVCLKYNILIISDEIYEKLIYDGLEHVSIASISKEVKESTIVINGVSKAFAMTGWRLGYAAGLRQIINTTSCVNSMTQKAALVAITENDGSIEKMRKEFEKRRNFLVSEFNKIDNIKCNIPEGAFYAMPNISYYLHHNTRKIKNSIDFCEYLLKENHIAIVPGSAFGADNYVRFSYANSMENIKEGLKRFETGLKSLSK
jgi:aspartate aminotransferase